MSQEFILDYFDEHDLHRGDMENHIHPQEDYLLCSDKHPIFLVADGVTLEHDSEGIYPNPSGAGQLAWQSCEIALEEIEKIYDQFTDADFFKVFQEVNVAAGQFNAQHSRTLENSNFWDHDIFATTFTAAVVRDNTLYWMSIGDSFVSVFDADNKHIFKTPDMWPDRHEYLPEGFGDLPLSERMKIIRHDYRNGIDEQGRLIGYGVVTGDERAERYIKTGSLPLPEDHLLTVYTDGYEAYFDHPEFVELLVSCSSDCKAQLQEFSKKYISKDTHKYGRERSLIAIKK